jgi:hypothetical protein
VGGDDDGGGVQARWLHAWAVVHHYPSLSALLAHALESLYADFARSPRGPATTMVASLNALWRAVGDHRFKAVIEAWSAAGNDQELAAELGPAIARFAKLVSPANAGRTGPLRDPTQKRSC